MDEAVALQFAADVEQAVASVRELATYAQQLADTAKEAAGGVASITEPATAAGDAIKGVADSSTAADGALTTTAGEARAAAAAYGQLGAAAKDAAGAQGEAATMTEAAGTDAAGAAAAGGGLGKYKTALLGIGIGAGVAVDGAVKYQAETTRLVTSAGESASNLDKVRQGMLTLSSQTDQSTAQLSSGMYLVESAGFHGANGLTVLKAAAQGAKDEGADLKTVANGVTDALVDFHLPASDAANVTSQLIAGVSRGKTTFEEFSGSMSNVLPLASAMHLKLADVTGVLAEMTAHGVSAQQASQDEANAMRELMKPNAAMVKEFNALGISSQQVYQSLGKNGLSGTMEWLSQVAQKGAPSIGQNYTQALGKLMGTAPGLQVALMTTGENLGSTTSAIKAIGGASADAKGNVDGFATVSQTASFKLGAAKNAAEAMGISLGEALLPGVMAVMGPITSFLQLIQSNHAASIAFAIVIGGILAGALGMKLAGALKDAKDGIKAVGDGIGWVVGKFQGVKGAADEAATAVETASGEAAAVQEADAAEAATANEEAAATSSGSWIKAAARQVAAAAVWVAQSVAKVAVVVAGYVAGAASTLAAWVATGIGMLAQGALWVAGMIAKVALVVASSVAGAVATAAAWVIANGVMLLGIGLVVAAVALAVYEIVTHWNTIVHGVEVAWDAIWKFVSGIVSDIVKFVKEHWTLLIGILGGPIGIAVALIVKYWGDIQKGAEDAVNAVINFFKALPGNILRAVGNLASLLLHAGEDIINGLLNGLKSAASGLLSWVGGIGSDISNVFSGVLGIFSPSRVFFEHGKNTMQGYIDGVKSMTGSARAAVAGVGGEVASAGAAGAIAPASGSTTVHVPVQVTAQGMTPDYTSPQFTQYIQGVVQEGVLRYGQLNPGNGLTPAWGH